MRVAVGSPRVRVALIVLLAVVLAAGPPPVEFAVAHEGHAPLPSKGVQVDVAKGLITLSPTAHRSLGVAAAIVEERVVEETILAYATLVTPWQRRRWVGPRLAGRIASLRVAAGETVEPGQLLAEIASPDLDALHLKLRNATNELSLATRQLDQLRSLAGVTPQRELIEAETKIEQANIAVRIARSKLRGLGLGDQAIDQALASPSADAALRLPLLSSLQGIVNHADLAVGKIVSSGEHLFEIHDPAVLWVKIGVLERDIAKVQAGQGVRLELTGFRGQIARAVVVSPGVEVDAATQLATAWAELSADSNASQYLPGMTGAARIILSLPTPRLAVPSAAVLGNGAEQYVLIEVAAAEKGFEYRRQSIEVLARSANWVQIRCDSLFPGDRVVSVGGQVLSSFFILGALRLSPEGIRNIGLRVETIGPRVIDDVLQMDGRIDLPPGGVALISSSLPGSLARLHVDRGQSVAAGQLVAEVHALGLQDMQFTLLAAESERRLWEEALRRLRTLGGSPLAATRRIWELEAARDAASHQVDSARRTLVGFGLTTGDVDEVLRTGQPREALPIRSPIDGVVARFDGVLGQGIAADESILEVQDLSRGWASGFLSEADAVRVPLGARARVRLLSDPNRVAEGHVARSARLFDPRSRSLTVWTEFEQAESHLLRRHFFVRVTAVIGPSPPVLAAPLSAIVREQSRSYAFVQLDNGLLERRLVELGRADDQWIEIRRGLLSTERIAVQGAAELQTTYASIR